MAKPWLPEPSEALIGRGPRIVQADLRTRVAWAVAWSSLALALILPALFGVRLGRGRERPVDGVFIFAVLAATVMVPTLGYFHRRSRRLVHWTAVPGTIEDHRGPGTSDHYVEVLAALAGHQASGATIAVAFRYRTRDGETRIGVSDLKPVDARTLATPGRKVLVLHDPADPERAEIYHPFRGGYRIVPRESR